MKLSEAMRLGAMLKPQAFGVLAIAQHGAVVSTCAMGAASEALGEIMLGDGDDHDSRLYDRYANVLNPIMSCPACGYRRATFRIVHHLNDSHRWTREQIADFIETIEHAQTNPATSREDVGTEQETVTASVSAAK